MGGCTSTHRPGTPVRAATPEDAAALAELFNAVTLDEVGVAWTDEADMRARITAPSFDLGNDAPLVFDKAQRLVAGLLLYPEGSPVTTVLAIGLVRPEATGRGLGTFITLLAEEHARRRIPAGSGRFTVRQTRFAQNDLAAGSSATSGMSVYGRGGGWRSSWATTAVRRRCRRAWNSLHSTPRATREPSMTPSTTRSEITGARQCADTRTG